MFKRFSLNWIQVHFKILNLLWLFDICCKFNFLLKLVYPKSNGWCIIPFQQGEFSALVDSEKRKHILFTKAFDVCFWSVYHDFFLWQEWKSDHKHASIYHKKYFLLSKILFYEIFDTIITLNAKGGVLITPLPN